MVLRRKVHRAGCAPAAHYHVTGLVRTHRHAGVRQVGHSLQQGVQLGLQRVEAGGGRIQLFFQAIHRRHDVVGAFTLGLALADLFGQGVALRLQLFGAGLQGLALRLQCGERVHLQEGLGGLAGFQPGDNAGQVFSEQGDV